MSIENEAEEGYICEGTAELTENGAYVIIK